MQLKSEDVGYCGKLFVVRKRGLLAEREGEKGLFFSIIHYSDILPVELNQSGTIYSFVEIFKFLPSFKVNFPLCTLAHTPRLPEHCIEYVRLLLWSKDNPFGGDEVAIDGDDPAHITWIFEKSVERATHYGIQGVTYRLIILSWVFSILILFETFDK